MPFAVKQNAHCNEADSALPFTVDKIRVSSAFLTLIKSHVQQNEKPQRILLFKLVVLLFSEHHQQCQCFYLKA